MSSDPQKRNAKPGGAPTRHSTLQVTRCTSCGASVMYLWLQLQPRKHWHCEMRPCKDVDEEVLARWRYTKRASRPGLHLALEDVAPNVKGRLTAAGFGSVAPPARRRSPSHRG